MANTIKFKLDCAKLLANNSREVILKIVPEIVPEEEKAQIIRWETHTKTF